MTPEQREITPGPYTCHECGRNASQLWPAPGGRMLCPGCQPLTPWQQQFVKNQSPPFECAPSPAPAPAPACVTPEQTEMRKHASELIKIAADILQARTWGEPIKRGIEADRHDEALCALAIRCRDLADRIGAASRALTLPGSAS